MELDDIVTVIGRLALDSGLQVEALRKQLKSLQAELETLKRGAVQELQRIEDVQRTPSA